MVVIGAAGAVGSAAVQIARWKGARTFGVVRHQSQEQDVTESGAQVLVNSEADTLADAVKAATDGRGADPDLRHRRRGDAGAVPERAGDERYG